MAYSRSTKAVDRVVKQLDKLVDANEDVVWLTADPTKLRYRLHEAFSVIERYPAKFNSYLGIKDKFVIRVRPNKVVAELRTPEVVEDSNLNVEKFNRTISTLLIPDVNTHIAIVGAVIANRAVDELHFPQAFLDDESLAKLFGWTSSNGYHIVRGNGLTLTKNDPGELAWKPHS